MVARTNSSDTHPASLDEETQRIASENQFRPYTFSEYVYDKALTKDASDLHEFERAQDRLERKATEPEDPGLLKKSAFIVPESIDYLFFSDVDGTLLDTEDAKVRAQAKGIVRWRQNRDELSGESPEDHRDAVNDYVNAIREEGLADAVYRSTGIEPDDLGPKFFGGPYQSWDKQAAIKSDRMRMFEDVPGFMRQANRNGLVTAISNSSTPATAKKFDVYDAFHDTMFLEQFSYIHGEHTEAAKPDPIMGEMARSALERETGDRWGDHIDVVVVGDSEYDLAFGESLAKKWGGRGTGIDVHSMCIDRENPTESDIVRMEEAYERVHGSS